MSPLAQAQANRNNKANTCWGVFPPIAGNVDVWGDLTLINKSFEQTSNNVAYLDEAQVVL